jgi:glycosyltransferase involved in cell wall biosynthesis
VYKLVKKNKIDIVHIHNYFPILTISVFKAARDAGAKVVHTAHNYRLWCIAGTLYRDQVGICTLCTKPNNILSGIRHKCYRSSLIQSAITKLSFWNYKKRGLLNYMDKLIVLSEFQHQLFIDFGIDKEKMVLKNNMVHFHPATIDVQKKKDYLFVGRLENSKGIKFLLSAWKQLPNYFILTIIGSGSLESKLRIEYASYANIVFLGELNKTKVGEYIQSAKYTIQPSLWYETFGLTIIESMMLGTPVIGLNIGTRTEMISSGKNGLLTTEADFIATIITSEHYDGYEQMCNNAVASALKYLPEHIIQHQLSIYKEVLN